MYWQNSLWNYHKLGLFIAFIVFFLVSPPIYKFINRYNYSPWWTAFTIGMLTWGFSFLLLHAFSSKSDNHEVIQNKDN